MNLIHVSLTALCDCQYLNNQLQQDKEKDQMLSGWFRHFANIVVHWHRCPTSQGHSYWISHWRYTQWSFLLFVRYLHTTENFLVIFGRYYVQWIWLFSNLFGHFVESIDVGAASQQSFPQNQAKYYPNVWHVVEQSLRQQDENIDALQYWKFV